MNRKKLLVTIDDWREFASTFIEVRRGLCGAKPREAVVGYIEDFLPVYIWPDHQVEGESWYVWLIFPGHGKCDRIVSQIVPGAYLDHEGNVIEHDPDHVIVLGTVTRAGDQPLLSLEMFKQEPEK